MKQILLAGTAMFVLATAQAGEFGARAEVIEVEPIYHTTHGAPTCHYPNAPRHRDLGATLRWDLGLAPLECTSPRPERRVDAYRVTYEWNGRRFTAVMDDDPGAFVPVRVQVH